MDVSEKTRLEKLLGMLGSSFDGERANAARMISAMAEKRKITIVELVYGPQTHRPQPSYEKARSKPAPNRGNSQTILNALSDIAASADEFEFTLTEWECQFASDVANRYSFDYELSEKQLAIAEKIIRKAEVARQHGAS